MNIPEITTWAFKNVKKRGKDEEYTIFEFTDDNNVSHKFKIDNIRHLIQDADAVGNYKEK